MDFYSRGNAFVKSAPDRYPAICLRSDRWNDFGYYTYYHIDYYDGSGNIIELGAVNILQRGETHTSLPSHFEKLSDDYCSIGSSREYYRRLKRISSDIFNNVLYSLRDCVINNDIYSQFREDLGFKNSLNRDSLYKNIKKWFNNFSTGIATEKQDFRFTFCTTLDEQNSGNIQASFDFTPITYKKDNRVDEIEPLSSRINVLIGKNGCGKTLCLSKLVNYLARIGDSGLQRLEGYDILFDKVIALSYSLFDSFTKPFEQKSRLEEFSSASEVSERKMNNYTYCGLIGKNGRMSIDELKSNFHSAYESIENKGRHEFWYKQIETLLSETFPLNDDNIHDFQNKNDYENFGLSSGQYFLYTLVTELISNIETNTIIIIDEPEIHLHPNAISNLIKTIYAILHEYDSYAVIATHSPIILQEIPRKYIFHMQRKGNESYTEPLAIETFGNDISTIVDKVFDVNIKHSNYKSVFLKLIDKDYNYYSLNSYGENPDKLYYKINSYFSDKLSFHARAFLKAMIDSDNKG